MTIDDFHAFCTSLPHTFADFPFDQKTLVMRVGTKEHSRMFALTNVEEFAFINLKTLPEESLRLQEKYAGTITPGFHMNKKYWISVAMDEALSDEYIEKLIEESYTLVLNGLPKKVREAL